ncbi:MAG TPA: hypothetical protein VGR14_07070 [Verrucomicrobiae bacterium]|jgi:hypothetical protein|nr:hypothetical protein [Verrucomicrobiae bacterium]
MNDFTFTSLCITAITLLAIAGRAAERIILNSARNTAQTDSSSKELVLGQAETDVGKRVKASPKELGRSGNWGYYEIIQRFKEDLESLENGQLLRDQSKVHEPKPYDIGEMLKVLQYMQRTTKLSEKNSDLETELIKITIANLALERLLAAPWQLLEKRNDKGAQKNEASRFDVDLFEAASNYLEKGREIKTFKEARKIRNSDPVVA